MPVDERDDSLIYSENFSPTPRFIFTLRYRSDVDRTPRGRQVLLRVAVIPSQAAGDAADFSTEMTGWNNGLSIFRFSFSISFSW